MRFLFLKMEETTGFLKYTENHLLETYKYSDEEGNQNFYCVSH